MLLVHQTVWCRMFDATLMRCPLPRGYLGNRLCLSELLLSFVIRTAKHNYRLSGNHFSIQIEVSVFRLWDTMSGSIANISEFDIKVTITLVWPETFFIKCTCNVGNWTNLNAGTIISKSLFQFLGVFLLNFQNACYYIAHVSGSLQNMNLIGILVVLRFCCRKFQQVKPVTEILSLLIIENKEA